jgi:8-oxo-dGTP pyrophosphatase MutT (NUDIX family)
VRNLFPVAVHLFLFKEDKILLLRRFNTGYEDGNYSVCAGHVEQGETYIEAMKREAMEEIGVELETLTPVQIMHRKSTVERFDYFFVSTSWKGEVFNAEEDKCDELLWVSINELPDNVIPYIKSALDNYHNNETFTSFGF